MRLESWRKKNRYTYKLMSESTGITISKLQRICSDRQCVKLIDAHKIVQMTGGKVDFVDMLPDGDVNFADMLPEGESL